MALEFGFYRSDFGNHRGDQFGLGNLFDFLAAWDGIPKNFRIVEGAYTCSRDASIRISSFNCIRLFPFVVL